jgi:hypothetical protein
LHWANLDRPWIACGKQHGSLALAQKNCQYANTGERLWFGSGPVTHQPGTTARQCNEWLVVFYDRGAAHSRSASGRSESGVEDQLGAGGTTVCKAICSETAGHQANPALKVTIFRFTKFCTETHCTGAGKEQRPATKTGSKEAAQAFLIACIAAQ